MASAQNNRANPQADPNIDIGNYYTPRRPAPIIGISINHPIANAARKIKNFLIHKQTLFSTTFSIKVTPIVAMVSLLGVAALFGGGITTAYNFGKTVEQKFLATTPTPTRSASSGSLTPTLIQIIANVSKTGTIKATYQLPPVTTVPTNTPTTSISSGPSTGTESATIMPLPTTIPTSLPILHYILVSKNGSITYLQSTKVTLQNYLGLHVLVTGSLNSTTNTLTVNSSGDVEILQ